MRTSAPTTLLVKSNLSCQLCASATAWTSGLLLLIVAKQLARFISNRYGKLVAVATNNLVLLNNK